MLETTPPESSSPDSTYSPSEMSNTNSLAQSHAVKMKAVSVDVFYGDAHAIKDATVDIFNNEVLALMGPSGCGKSTFLRCLNRMNDYVEGARVTGTITLDDTNIYSDGVDPVQVRARIGMVAQAPNPFPKSVFENVAFGPRLHGLYDTRDELEGMVETSLRRAGLWEEIKDHLDQPGSSLSGGQQQRLCIARAIANRPDVLLMDEPVSALDPQSAAIIEDLIRELAERYAIVLVTHNMEQARRIADRTAFFYVGELLEVNNTIELFENPTEERTRRYMEGVFG